MFSLYGVVRTCAPTPSLDRSIFAWHKMSAIIGPARGKMEEAELEATAGADAGAGSGDAFVKIYPN